MSIKISAEQSPKTPGGEAFDHIFVESIVLKRARETYEWSAEFNFSHAVPDANGGYIITRRVQSVTIPNFDTYALDNYVASKPAAVNAHVAMQIAIAEAIGLLKPQFSSAQYVAE